MKNQYFGDINDYRKYGLLRILAGDGSLKVGICWMLTRDDEGADGGRTQYIQSPGQWREFDSELFDLLGEALRANDRNVDRAKTAGFIPGARYYPPYLDAYLSVADRDARRNIRLGYFNQMLSQFKGVDLIFFDPDNGLEVKSVPCCRKKSPKYLYWEEAMQAFQQGASLLIYQHFPMIDHTSFIKDKAREIAENLRPEGIIAFSTKFVVFFLAIQGKHLKSLNGKLRDVTETWRNEFQVFPILS